MGKTYLLTICTVWCCWFALVFTWNHWESQTFSEIISNLFLTKTLKFLHWFLMQPKTASLPSRNIYFVNGSWNSFRSITLQQALFLVWLFTSVVQLRTFPLPNYKFPKYFSTFIHYMQICYLNIFFLGSIGEVIQTTVF